MYNRDLLGEIVPKEGLECKEYSKTRCKGRKNLFICKLLRPFFSFFRRLFFLGLMSFFPSLRQRGRFLSFFFLSVLFPLFLSFLLVLFFSFLNFLAILFVISFAIQPSEQMAIQLKISMLYTIFRSSFCSPFCSPFCCFLVQNVDTDVSYYSSVDIMIKKTPTESCKTVGDNIFFVGVLKISVGVLKFFVGVFITS